MLAFIIKIDSEMNVLRRFFFKIPVKTDGKTEFFGEM